MIKTSFINPFSSDAKEIVSRLGNVENLDTKNEELVNIINHTPGQIFDNTVKLPDTLTQLSVHRFEWYLFRKTDNFNEKEYEYLFNSDIHEFDIVSFYLLCQAVAIGYGPDSHEAKQVIESESDIISHRLERLKSESVDFQSNFLRNTLNQLVDTNNVQWTDLKEVLELGELNLDDLLIVNGRVIIEYEDFMEEYGHLIQNRSSQDMYQVTGGIELKINLLKSIIMLYTKEYIENVAQMAQRMVEPNPVILKLSDEIKDIQLQAQEAKYKGSSGSNFEDDKPVSFEIEAFPPCARKCMEGIKSGGRNDAIVLFLTPFVSYARLFPGIFSKNQKMKVSDVDPSLDITHNEVIPMIYDAAESCRPPLFKDQPQEKVNINSKLGFGMHSDLKIDHEGETQWYTPMSCEKIKLHMPSLCRPNIDCKKIGNPLTYYNRKRKIMKIKNNANNMEKQVNNDGN